MSETPRPSRDIYNDDDFPVSLVRKTIFAGTGRPVEAIAGKPLIAVISSATEINPGHMHLSELAARVKDGVWSAGGAPFECNLPAPCDGVAMGHAGMRFVLAQRDLIADLAETHARSMRFDGVVFLASCDKIIPGMIMAAARLNLPAIVVTGGANTFAVRYSPGFKQSISHKDYADLADKLSTASCATCGACEIMGTANTFQCMAEALGLALSGSAAVPAFHAQKRREAQAAGERIVGMVKEGLSSGKILTRAALENALAVDMAIGGSTNASLHLPAIARELGLTLSLSDFNSMAEKVPTLLSIAPNGPHGMTDLFRAGGIPAVMKVLAGDLHLDALTVSGRSVAQVVEAARVLDESVIPPRDRPRLPQGGTVALFGSLAPEGSVIKQSAVSPEMRVFEGPAAVFESEADCLAAIRENRLSDGSVLVIRNEGPKGAPGMPEMLAVTMALDLSDLKRVALVTDGRFSGATAGPCVGHVSPEAFAGGPIALVRDGDKIALDIPGRKIDLLVSESELAARRASWKPVLREAPPGYMRRYRRHVGSAAKGAVLD